MNRDEHNLADAQWVARCAHALRGQWPHADPTSLEEAATALWDDASLRELAPGDAAIAWLRRGLPESALSRAAIVRDADDA